MNPDRADRLLQEANDKIMALRQELAETNEGVVALNLELEQRIEEKQRAEEALQEANRELESFSYSVSHDLKAPLRAITGFSRILLDTRGNDLDSDGQRLLGLIDANAREMIQLINDILSFSRLGSKALQPVRFNTRELVQSIIDTMEINRPLDTITVTLSDLPTIIADRSLMRQVFVNLIINAVKYTSRIPHAVISIGAEEHGRDIVFYVKDNGAGFDMKYVDRLFGVFQRLHSTRDFSGTGIGLANVKRIISRHGGRVWAHGQINQGAAFYVSLPCPDLHCAGSVEWKSEPGNSLPGVAEPHSWVQTAMDYRNTNE